MKKRFGKKALSDVISTLLILLLVFVAVAILWVVIRNVINQGSEQVTLGKFTLDLKIDQVSVDEIANQVSVRVKRNTGDGEFVGLKIIVSDDENSDIFNFNGSLDVYEKQEFIFNLVQVDSSNIKKIQVAPIFRLSSGKEVVGDVKDTWESSEGISNFDDDEEQCIPYCPSGAQCGSDGCGGVCGENNCSGATPNCVNYQCSAGQCIPNCANKQCGSDGCSGTCGSCVLSNAISSCSANFQCVISNCNSGYANCDSNALNGCETQLGTNTNCASCGNVCNSTQTCTNNVCVNNAVQNTRQGLIFAPTLNPATFMTDFYCSGNCPEVKILPEGSGNYVMESYLSRTTSTRPERTEVVPHSPNEAYQFQYGKDYWFGFSLYVKKDFVFDNLCGDAFVQFHAREDDGAEDSCTRNPPVALYSEEGRLILRVKSDSKENTCESGSRVYETSDEYDIGTLNKGAWNDFVLHIKWSYNETGLLELWRDDELVVQHDGGNCFNDDRGPYTKLGVYKWDYDNVPFKTCGTEEINYYHDEIRLGGPDSSYEDVAPDDLPNID